MSIITSREELEVAKTTLAASTDEALSRDLVDWTIASYRSSEQYRELVQQQLAVRDLHAEEETWIGLIAEELRRRRSRPREAVS